MKKKSLTLFLVLFAALSAFCASKKNIINATGGNIEQVSQKKKLAFFYDENNSNALQVAIQESNFAVAYWLAENEICDANHQNIFGRTPLNDAIESQDIDIVKMLIEHGAKIQRTTYQQDPVVQTVVLGNLEAAEYFKEIGVKYNFLLADGRNMIHTATAVSQKDMVPFLVQSGCNIDALDHAGLTPLLISIENDDYDMLKALVANGANIEKKNSAGQTPVFFAVEKFSNAAVDALIESKADIEAKDSKSRTPFLFAYEVDNISAAESLLRTGATFPRTQLLTALKDKKYSYLRPLLNAGADITVTDSAGQNVLHIASAKSDGSSLSLFLSSKDAARIVNVKDNKGSTPLLLACGAGTGFTNGVQTLLKAGASISDTDASGNNALHASVQTNSDSSSKELSQLVLGKSAALLNAVNQSGQTPLLIALKSGKADTSAYLLSRKADVTPKDSTGNTALHYASNAGLNDAAKKCVSLGADINAVNNSKETAMAIAAKKQNEELAEYFLSLRGINIDIADNTGKSARSYLRDLYNLRIQESEQRRAQLMEVRQKAWDAAATARNEKYKLEQQQRNTDNAIAAGILGAAIAAQQVLINTQEKIANECTQKIDDEFKLTDRYLAKLRSLNAIPRQ